MRKISLAIALLLTASTIVLANDHDKKYDLWGDDHHVYDSHDGKHIPPSTPITTPVVTSIAAPIINTNTNTNANQNSNTSTSSSTSGATAIGGNANVAIGPTTNTNTAIGGAGGQGGQGGAATQSQTSSANNGGQNNSQSTTYVTPRQAPSAVAPTSLPTAPCRVAGSLGVSAPIGGISLGGSKRDKECDAREAARAFAALGDTQSALKLLCTTKAAVKAKLEACQGLQ